MRYSRNRQPIPASTGLISLIPCTWPDPEVSTKCVGVSTHFCRRKRSIFCILSYSCLFSLHLLPPYLHLPLSSFIFLPIAFLILIPPLSLSLYLSPSLIMHTLPSSIVLKLLRGYPAHDYQKELRMHPFHYWQRHGWMQIIS